MCKINPKFEFDDFGRVYCQFHQDYHLFIESSHRPLPEYESKRLYTCRTCNHYKFNDCQFSSKEIKRLLLAVKFHMYRCEICGGNIERMFNIIYKKKLENKQGVKVPLLCCDCIINLCQQDVLKAFKVQRNTIFYVSLSLLSASLFLFFILNIMFPHFLIYTLTLSGFLLTFSLRFFWSSWKLSKSIKNSPIIRNVGK